MTSNQKHVLVTGGTGFVATHTIDQLIKAGYKVTATTRDAVKAQSLYTTFPAYVGTVTFVSVPDFTISGAFERVFASESFDYVLHTASPIPIPTDDVKQDIIDPAIEGTTNLLKDAAKAADKNLKRVVITGSAVSAVDYRTLEGPPRATPYSEKDWNPITVSTAVSTKNFGLAYIASKTHAEHAAWAFMAAEKPAFDLTVLLPVIVLGPILTPIAGPKQIEQGAKRHVYEVFDGSHERTDFKFSFYDHVDVRDVARAHVLSMTTPAASMQRIPLATTDVPLTPQSVANIINQHFPQLEKRVAKGEAEQIWPEGVDATRFDTSKAHEVFGQEWEFRSLETTVVDLVGQLMEEERAWGN